ncbi:hypothetical protein OFAG_01152 [Oxalobacter formigenes HOxBLS]|uniref:Uncharacterized protein n=2 Tax=Oxalobacter paraformigenes TaxID=556268 RepID=C3X463_9BURK|nr:hypothetical protein OFAG_01152 [Oxalobacter paraformigenes]
MGQPYPPQFIFMKSNLKVFLVSFLFSFGFHVFAGDIEEGRRLFNAGKYEEAMSCFMKPDAQQKPEVMNHIAYMYHKGLGVEKDQQIAVGWFKKAAELGLAKAQFNLGLSYQKGQGASKDIHKAIEWFRKSAEQGYAKAEAKMGYYTVTGTGVKQNFTEALRWYRRAAEHGDIASYADIGHFYAQGNGVKKDKNRAAQYYIMGAEKGDPEAQYWLGRAYEQGRGIKHDPERALYWLKQSANKGNWQAMRELSVIYGSALLGQAIDEKLALQWGEKAEETRRKSGETNPDVERRLRFFGVDADRLTKDGQ